MSEALPSDIAENSFSHVPATMGEYNKLGVFYDVHLVELLHLVTVMFELEATTSPLYALRVASICRARFLTSSVW